MYKRYILDGRIKNKQWVLFSVIQLFSQQRFFGDDGFSQYVSLSTNT